MKIRKALIMIAFAALLIAVFPMTVSADTGPKPSVSVDFIGMSDELCYGTLLSERPSTGPHSAWDGDPEHGRHKGNYEYAALDYETWSKLVGYRDSDGYYYLEEAVWELGEKKELRWGYYPPERFKILLYYPESDSFLVSGILERYAFDSYYTVDMTDLGAGEGITASPTLSAYRSYEWQSESLNLLLRIVITIALEMLIALAFGFTEKRALLILIIVNSATQVALNLALNLINFRSGGGAFMLEYLKLELLVIILEAVVYSVLMRIFLARKRHIMIPILYSVVANALSLIAGMYIAELVPGIF